MVNFSKACQCQCSRKGSWKGGLAEMHINYHQQRLLIHHTAFQVSERSKSAFVQFWHVVQFS